MMTSVKEQFEDIRSMALLMSEPMPVRVTSGVYESFNAVVKPDGSMVLDNGFRVVYNHPIRQMKIMSIKIRK
jgi:hypothetical protein